VFDLLLCIESRIYRDGLTALLTAACSIGRVAACAGTAQIEALLRAGPCDMVLIDVAMTAGSGDPAGTVTAAYRAAGGRPVIALGLEESDEKVLSFIEAGAAAFVTKNESIDDLVRVIAAAARGELLCPPRVARLMQERLALLAVSQGRRADLGKLSGREQHILDLVEQRMSNKQIARTLDLEVSTIKNHMHNIIVKLCVKNRREAAAMLRCGVADLPRAAAGR
jgi:two-component system nitrate/nitrite response regulator NarL